MKTVFTYISNHKETLLLIAILGICLCGIMPFLLLCQYNVPGASDDMFHAINMTNRSYFNAIWHWYFVDGYNGRFANAFFMLVPGRFFMKSWFGVVFPLVVFAALYLSLRYLVRSFSSVSEKLTWVLPAIFFAFIVSYVPSVKQFYWYSGATVYTVPAVLYFFLLGILIRHFNENLTVKKMCVIGVLLFFIICSNENWAIGTIITVMLFSLNVLLEKKLSTKQWTLVGLAFLFFVMLVFAPGSMRRLDSESDVCANGNLLASMVLLFTHVGTYFSSWFCNVGAILLFGGCFLLRKYTKQNVLKNLSIQLLVISFFVILILGIFILLYSLGHFGPIRERGLIPIFVVEVAFAALILIRVGENLWNKLDGKVSISAYTQYCVIAVGLLLSISASSNVKNAYSDIFSGNAQRDAEENLWVQSYLMNSPVDSVSVPQVRNQSKTLYYFYIPGTKPSWEYWIAKTYFNKKDISVNSSMSMSEFRKANSLPAKKE